MKLTVYIETTIVGHLTSRLPSDIKVMSQMLDTRQWWGQSRDDYDLFISELVQQEILKGDPSAAAERLVAINAIPSVPILDSARQLAKDLLNQHGLPDKARADALHLAICATNQMDYLLTWNCRHLANATRRKILRGRESLTPTCSRLFIPAAKLDRRDKSRPTFCSFSIRRTGIPAIPRSRLSCGVGGESVANPPGCFWADRSNPHKAREYADG